MSNLGGMGYIGDAADYTPDFFSDDSDSSDVTPWDYSKDYSGNMGNDIPIGTATVVGAPSGLRLRAAPVSGNTLALMPNGTTVPFGPSGTEGWAYVEYGGFQGYASTDYLSPTDDGGGQNVAPPGPYPLPLPPDPPTPDPDVDPNVDPVPDDQAASGGIPTPVLVVGALVGLLGLYYAFK